MASNVIGQQNGVGEYTFTNLDNSYGGQTTELIKLEEGKVTILGGAIVATPDSVTIPSLSGGGFTPGGDLDGTSTEQTVVGIQGNPVAASSPSYGETFYWDNEGSTWITGILPVEGGGIGANNVTADFIFAAPAGVTGAPSFRPMDIRDLPSATVGITPAGSSSGSATLSALDASAYTLYLVEDVALTCDFGSVPSNTSTTTSVLVYNDVGELGNHNISVSGIGGWIGAAPTFPISVAPGEAYMLVVTNYWFGEGTIVLGSWQSVTLL